MADDAPGPVTEPGVLFLVGGAGAGSRAGGRGRATPGLTACAFVPGGVEVAGGLAEAARRTSGCGRRSGVLWRVAEFRAMHLAQLDKRGRKLAWRDWFCAMTCRCGSRRSAASRRSIHHKAAPSGIAGAIAAAGVPVAAEAGGWW